MSEEYLKEIKRFFVMFLFVFADCSMVNPSEYKSQFTSFGNPHEQQISVYNRAFDLYFDTRTARQQYEAG